MSLRKLISLPVFLFLFISNIYIQAQPAGKILYLDGIDDYLNLPQKMISNNTTITIETWFKTTKYGVIAGFQSGYFSQNAPNYIPAIYIGTDGLLRGYLWNGTKTPIVTSKTFNDGTWHHVALVGKQNQIALYADGKLIGTQDGQIDHVDMYLNQFGTGVGGIYPSTGVYWFSFEGNLDETRIWNIAKSESDISAGMNQTFSAGTTGLIGYWNYENINGTTVYDASGNSNNGVLYNGALIQNDNQTTTDYALKLDGLDDFIKLPDGLVNGDVILTVESRFKTSKGGVIFGYQNSNYPDLPVSYVPAIYVGKNGKVYGEFWYGTVAPIETSNTYNDGMWHHVALVGNSTTQSLFVDGIFIGQKEGSIVGYDMSKNQFGIGNTGISGQEWPSVDAGWFPFDGLLDEMRIWKTNRTSTEILNYMNGNLAGIIDDLLGYWKCNEGIGLTAFDFTSKKNDATLINGPVWVDPSVTVGVKSVDQEIPDVFTLYQNYPNPFNPSTKIRFSLPNNGFIKLELFSLLGAKVQSLFEGQLSAGVHEINFHSEELSSGTYFYKLSNGINTYTKKLILLK